MSRCAGIIHTSALRPQLFVSASLPNTATLFTLHSREGVVTAGTGGDKSEIEADTGYVSTNLSSQAPGAQPTLSAAFTCVQGQPQARSSKPRQPTSAHTWHRSSSILQASTCNRHGRPCFVLPKAQRWNFLGYRSENLWDARGDAGREPLPCCREPGDMSDLVTSDKNKSCGLHGHKSKVSQGKTQAHCRDILTQDLP